MKLGLNTLLFTAGFDESHLPLLDKVKQWGFDGIEIARFSFDGYPARSIGQKAREELIELLVNALALFVKKGSPIKVFQAYGRSLSSSSTTIMTKIMSKVEQVVEWRDELKKVISSQKGKL
jgi:sugar phosphate isomerase/epimerase